MNWGNAGWILIGFFVFLAMFDSCASDQVITDCDDVNALGKLECAVSPLGAGGRRVLDGRGEQKQNSEEWQQRTGQENEVDPDRLRDTTNSFTGTRD